jgi:type II secretory pathway pseudopilin PulG
MSIKSTRRPGFTLVETLMSAAAVLLALSAILFFYINSSNTDQMSEKESEYYRLYTTLEMKLKRDLRSAVRIEQPGPDEYGIITLSRGADGAAVEKEIIYRAASANVIERKYKGQVEKYDFSKFESLYKKQNDSKFIFKIIR